MALQVAVEILVLSDRDEIYNVPLVVDDVSDEPLVILGLEFFPPDLAQSPALPVSSVGVLEDLRLHFVEPVNDGWREAFAIFVVTWSGEPGIWHLPPPPLDGLGKPRLDLGRPLQDLLNELERQIRIVLSDHRQFDVSARLLAERSMLPFSPRGELALQGLVHAQIQRHH